MARLTKISRREFISSIQQTISVIDFPVTSIALVRTFIAVMHRLVLIAYNCTQQSRIWPAFQIGDINFRIIQLIDHSCLLIIACHRRGDSFYDTDTVFPSNIAENGCIIPWSRFLSGDARLFTHTSTPLQLQTFFCCVTISSIASWM